MGSEMCIRDRPRGTPGHEAGFNVGDEIIAIDDYRVAAAGWRQRLDLYRAGDEVAFLIARRERLLRLDARFGERPPEGWRLQPVESPSPAQAEHLDAWLGRGAAP